MLDLCVTFCAACDVCFIISTVKDFLDEKRASRYEYVYKVGYEQARQEMLKK